MNIFNSFSNRARNVLRTARTIALQSGSPSIDTEYILIAIWNEQDGVACNVLKNLDVTDITIGDAFASQLEKKEQNPAAAPSEKVPFSNDAKEVFKEAISQHRHLKSSVTGTEHLLLGLLGVSNTTAYKILEQLGLTRDNVVKEIASILGNTEVDENQLDVLKEQQLSVEAKKAKKMRKQKQKSESPNLDQFGIDMTEMAAQGKIDPIIGRHAERERVMQVLGRKTKNNPVLIGEPGVGKSKVVEGIALDIIAGNVPDALKGRRLFALDLAAMVAGTKYRGQFEERIKQVMKEVEDNDDVILFIDEIHTMVGAGGSEGGMDASNILKPALSRGLLQCIGATTFDEYRKHIEKDGALERRFQPIIVEPSTPKETLDILRGLQETYEKFHGVSYTDLALHTTVDLAEKYVNGRFFPDKAIDIIDEAGSRVKMSSTFKPQHIVDKENELEDLDREQDRAVSAQDFEEAASIRDRKTDFRKEIEELIEIWKTSSEEASRVIDENIVSMIVSKMTNVPVSQMSEEESSRLLQIEEELHKKVISQDEAIVRIAQAIRRSRAGLKSSKRPMGSFLFVGPTGVGKTLLCKVLSKFLFGTEDSLVHLDMSEYMEKHNASRLVGAPPGYVGYEEGGQLTEKIRRKPYSIVLFDEIEKAHPDVFNMLLQIMEEGRLTDNFGRHTSFRNTIIIMTSNVGSDLIKQKGGLGFTTEGVDSTFDAMKATLGEAVEAMFKPEFLNRLDDTVVFKPLTKEDIGEIVKIELTEVYENLAEQGLTIKMTDEALAFLVEKGYDQAFGARPLRRAIEKYIENPLSEEILRGSFKDFCQIKTMVDVTNDCLVFAQDEDETS